MYDPIAFSRGHNNAHVYAKHARSRVGHEESGFKLMCNFAFTDASSGPFLWECAFFQSAGACFELVHVGETVALVEIFNFSGSVANATKIEVLLHRRWVARISCVLVDLSWRRGGPVARRFLCFL